MLKEEICNLLQDSFNINVLIFRGIITNLINNIIIKERKKEANNILVYASFKKKKYLCMLITFFFSRLRVLFYLVQF